MVNSAGHSKINLVMNNIAFFLEPASYSPKKAGFATLCGPCIRLALSPSLKMEDWSEWRPFYKGCVGQLSSPKAPWLWGRAGQRKPSDEMLKANEGHPHRGHESFYGDSSINLLLNSNKCIHIMVLCQLCLIYKYM